MIILTGDVHQMSLKTKDQRYLRQREVDAACGYAELAASYGMKVTLFLTGKLFVEEADGALKLARMPNVSLGGHTFSAYQPLLFHRLSKLFLRQFMGPREFQRLDIERTLALIRQATHRPVYSWRNHAYLSDRHTIPLLREAGVRYLSNEVNGDLLRPYSNQGLIQVPINVMTDHEHLYHAHRDEDYVKQWVQKTGFSDTWGACSYHASDWAEQVLLQTKRIVRQKGVATLLIHPACMEALDQFKTLEFLLSRLQELPNFWMHEVPVEEAQPLSA